MTDLFEEPEDATPLAPQERVGSLQSWITHRRDLNEAKRDNILDGAAWARGRRRLSLDGMLRVEFVQTLHKRMFGGVWQWAGTFRTTERNLGIDAYGIPTELGVLLDDVGYWIANDTYPRDEIAIRYHHRLVAIHPFPNGNGRHARLAADLLVERLDGDPFGWGGGTLADVGELRSLYIAALKAADGYDIRPLLVFARS